MVLTPFFSRSCSQTSIPLLRRLLIQRIPSRYASSNHPHDHEHENNTPKTSPTLTPSELLTLSTAKQLKGDIPEAITLASRALTVQRNEDDQAGVADTSLFLGKLFQLSEQYPEAEISFKEACSIHNSLSSTSPAALGDTTHIHNECKALSHLATIQKLLLQYPQSEQSYRQALTGLEHSVGWQDGLTNHTALQLSLLYREQCRYTDARRVLENMKKQLEEVFGVGDPRALQVNGELAEVMVEVGERGRAVGLLEEVVEGLPGGSPEARRAFMRLDDLREDEEGC